MPRDSHSSDDSEAQEERETPTYSRPWPDDSGEYEFRWVTVPPHMARRTRIGEIMSEQQWRDRGLVMSLGWVHIGYYAGCTTWLFRRKLPLPTTESSAAALPNE